jgi:hypothetical protein
LIQAELEAGDSAGIEHYRRAGELLLEAKAQLLHGEWKGWIERNFHRSAKTASEYMKLAEAVKSEPRRVFASLRAATRPTAGSKVSWQQPVQQIISRVNTEALAKEYQDRNRETAEMHKLGHQLIDIGYKTLAATLHPDKRGGSNQAMARLNKVRSIPGGDLSYQRAELADAVKIISGRQRMRFSLPRNFMHQSKEAI